MDAKTKSMTWSQMVAVEPALGSLLAEIRKVKDDKTKPAFCANAWWYGYGSRADCGFKARFIYLVGFHATKKELRTMEAYSFAYNKLYSALPDCRNCQCL
jgi:hypothetical protein